MKKQLLFIVLISFALLNFNCKKTLTGPDSPFVLTVEDVSCTEAWVKITSTNFQNPSSLTLFVNDKPNQTLALVSSDTLLYIDSLLPNQSYKIKAAFVTNNQPQTTNEVIATTMDTTNHNFTWQTFTFGEHSSSTLYDVAIIDENNIWAVGEIYTKDSYSRDSLGNWIDPYNAVHWNGSEWELKRIYYNYRGTPSWSPIRTVFAFADNDIWYSSGLHWNGKVFEQPNTSAFSGWSPNKMWGTSSNDLYAVGNNGNIAHYDGNYWKKIGSGTAMDLYDIASVDGKNIYISGGDFQNTEGVLLNGDKTGFKILKEGRNINADEVFKPYFAGIGKTIWESNKHTLLFGGNLLYQYKFGEIDFVKSFPGNYFKENVHGEYFGFISMVRGNSVNDIILVGEGNTVRHFNGKTWQQLGLRYDFNSDYTWLAVAMKNDLLITVGRSTSKAIIMVLKR